MNTVEILYKLTNYFPPSSTFLIIFTINKRSILQQYYLVNIKKTITCFMTTAPSIIKKALTK